MSKKSIGLIWVALAAAAYGQHEVDLGKSVIYSATGFVTEARKVAANPTVVTAEQIEKKDYKTVLDILEDIPSVAFTKNTFGTTVDLRGQGPSVAKRNVQILIDGVAVNSLDTSMTSTPMNTVAVDSIERIEVIPGGGSVLYGNGTAGGVINIITKRGKGLRANAGYDYTSFGGNKYDISAGQSFGKFDVNLTYSKTDADGYRDESHDDTDYFQGNLRYDISDTQSLEFKYAKYKSEIMAPESLTKEQVSADRKQSGENITRVTTDKDDYVLTYNTKLTSNLDLNVVAFHQETNMDIGDKGEKSYGFFDDKKTGIKPKLKYSYGDDSSLILGMDYIDNEAQRWANMDQMGINVTTNDFTKKTFGIFAMNNYKYNKFEFNQGIRYEKSDYDISRTSVTKMGQMSVNKSINKNRDMDNFAFELSGSYLYSDTGKLYTRLEQGFTSPPPALLTDTVPTGVMSSKYELNDLDSETYRSIEIGMSDFVGNTSINVSIFYTLTHDEIYTYMPSSSNVTNYNIDKTRRYGAEISLEHYFGKLTLSESYQYINAKIEDGTAKTYDASGNRTDGADLAGNKIEGVPENKFTFGADYQFTSRFNVNGEVVYTGSSYIDNDNESGKKSSYIITNIRAGYTFDNGLNIYAGINNLFNEQYYDSINYSTAGIFTYDPAAERNYYVGFRYSL
ncbi:MULTISPECIES: TonB-dependent receptor family protein [Fusobacterium]|uniref:TonB-dependent receptor family protein n=1 Tax=Fusobacterium TaxID=848 RepID=UPI0008A47A58|nr:MULTISPECIES: TonB-dependent receptor [Fusobacterium]OFL86623.1 hemin receptor [Fusobacterium sp. HMSC073F01]